MFKILSSIDLPGNISKIKKKKDSRAKDASKPNKADLISNKSGNFSFR